jgi:hypothetical protein
MGEPSGNSLRSWEPRERRFSGSFHRWQCGLVARQGTFERVAQVD